MSTYVTPWYRVITIWKSLHASIYGAVRTAVAQKRASEPSSLKSDGPTFQTTLPTPPGRLEPRRVDPLFETRGPWHRPQFGTPGVHTPGVHTPAFTTSTATAVAPSRSFAYLKRKRNSTSTPEPKDVEMEEASYAQTPTPPTTPPTTAQDMGATGNRPSSFTARGGEAQGEEPVRGRATTPLTQPSTQAQDMSATQDHAGSFTGQRTTAEEEQAKAPEPIFTATPDTVHPKSPYTSTPDSGSYQIDAHSHSSTTLHQETSELYLRYASEIVMEDGLDPNDPMHKGYFGTWNGHRMYVSTEADYCECGLGGSHFLICGHSVLSKEPCGSTCKTLKQEHEPFKCSQCEDVVKHLLNNQITPAERNKLKLPKQKNTALFLACCVETVTRHMPTAKTKVAETLTSIVMQNYGHPALAYTTVQDPNEPKNMAEMFQQHHERMQKKKRDALAQTPSLNPHEQRKDTNIPNDAALPPPTTPKTRKSNPATHIDPILSFTRGTKRSSSPPPTPSKKPKLRLATHPEPITRNTRGTKRSLSASPSRTAKRVELFSPPRFGVVAFGGARDGGEGEGERGRKRWRGGEEEGWDGDEEL